ncbi:gem-associated protein 2-like isoform X2 [Artemia franciscana]|uniref:gem-associated protein 2-like isoform X2 n=1 Tax=Artemia franciscana TaxID=6661 RepID=UPI0032DAE70E
MEDVNDQEEYGVKRAFFVPNDVFNPENAPTTGLEYLRKVMFETAKCPATVVADVDPSWKKVSSKVEASVERRVPDRFLPTERFEAEVIANFSRLRLEVSQCRSSKTKMESDIPVPQQHYEWADLCYGNEFALKHYDQNIRPNNETTEKKAVMKPYLSFVLKMSQADIEKLLELHKEWLEPPGSFTLAIGQWLFSLMALIEKPLTAEFVSVLRDICRVCQRERSILVGISGR